MITVNEQGQEIVMNHIATELNKEALLEINRRNISIEQYAREHNLTSRISSIETAGIELRLERIESAINKTARKSTIKAESNVKLEINDKGLVHRVNKIRRQKVFKSMSVRPEQKIIDLVRIKELESFDNYSGLCW